MQLPVNLNHCMPEFECRLWLFGHNRSLRGQPQAGEEFGMRAKNQGGSFRYREINQNAEAKCRARHMHIALANSRGDEAAKGRRGASDDKQGWVAGVRRPNQQ